MIKSRMMRWAGHVAHMEEERNAHTILVGKTEGKRPLAMPRYQLEGNVKMDLKETGWESMDWTNLSQDTDNWQAVENMIMNVQVS
jgi:hypothetical protein